LEDFGFLPLLKTSPINGIFGIHFFYRLPALTFVLQKSWFIALKRAINQIIAKASGTFMALH
jgi:hypothetical protein